MPFSSQFDALEFDKIEWPYNRIESELSPFPRIVRGENVAIDCGGKLMKRPGTVEIPNTSKTSSLRADRLWLYETHESPAKVWIIGSFYNPATGYWEIWYCRPSTGTTWTKLTDYRDIHRSTRPHEGVASRGFFYLKGFPPASSSEKLGTVVLDGRQYPILVRPWGILPPTQPARVVGKVTTLAQDIDDSQTTITVTSSSGFPSTPFVIQVEFEQMEVTSVSGNTWTVTRAYNGTEASHHDAGIVILWRNWRASRHRVDVNYGWIYTYCYETVTGQVSNHAPVETNIDMPPSATGPFFDLIPKIKVRGHADTVNVPYIRIYRTTDGGGTFYFVEKIQNTGDTDIEYEDKSLATGPNGEYKDDPLPDNVLDMATVAPSTTSNSPPPSVAAPKVVGEDTPEASTPIVSYAGRLWYGIGNHLFYSAQEEITEGVPEECWPSGLTGNYFRFNYPIVNLAVARESLFVFTTQQTYVITGNNKETFNATTAFSDTGALVNSPRSCISFKGSIAFVTHDCRVAIITSSRQEPVVISDPLYTDLVDEIAAGRELQLVYWADLEKEWLMVCSHDPNDTSYSRQWVYNFSLSEKHRTDFWYTPWTIRACSALSGRIEENSSRRRLVFLVSNGSQFRLVRLDPTGRTATDCLPDGTNQGFSFYFDTYLMTIPPGNHVNTLRKPAFVPCVYSVIMERTVFAGDSDPDVYYYKDDFWTTPFPLVYVEDPPRRPQSKAYKTLMFPINEVAYRIAFRVEKKVSPDRFEMQSFVVVWNPEAGA